MRRSPKVWTDAPPTGTGVQLTKVRPEGRLPWNAWYGGRIVMFCPTAGWAFAAVQREAS